MADRSLAGKRIVVTRPDADAAALVEGLTELGADVSVVPLIEIEPTDSHELRALVASGDHDWIVVTSVNAVRTIEAGLAEIQARFAAVGPLTASALRERGVEPEFVPQRFAAEEIAHGLEPLAGKRVLLPQSEIAEPLLADDLRARGALVDVVDAYRTVELDPDEAGLAELRLADAILLASGSAARSLARALAPEERTLVVCIGPSTAAVASSAGLRVDLVAEEATGEGMIAALAAHFGGRA